MNAQPASVAGGHVSKPDSRHQRRTQVLKQTSDSSYPLNDSASPGDKSQSTSWLAGSDAKKFAAKATRTSTVFNEAGTVPDSGESSEATSNPQSGLKDKQNKVASVNELNNCLPGHDQALPTPNASRIDDIIRQGIISTGYSEGNLKCVEESQICHRNLLNRSRLAQAQANVQTNVPLDRQALENNERASSDEPTTTASDKLDESNDKSTDVGKVSSSSNVVVETTEPNRSPESKASRLAQLHGDLVVAVQRTSVGAPDYSNTLSFLKLLSNLPKSITQRSKSSNTLAPEVADYLATSKRAQCDQIMMATSGVGKSVDRNKSISNKQQYAREMVSTTNLDDLKLEASSEDPAKAAMLPRRVSCRDHRSIKIVAPPAVLLTGSVKANSTSETDTARKMSDQTGTIKTSSIAASNTTTTTTLTTRSSATSLSSCILSESSNSEARLRWSKKMDFLLSIIGFAVDLANIWRFPYLVYKNGGGVFLIPYVIMLIFGGIPLFFLELCLGQFVKKGPITVWNKICPSMKGVGYCSILISWYVSFYYNILIAWSVYFICRSLQSFGDKLPWEDCDNSWNSNGTCLSISQLKSKCSTRNLTLEACRKETFANVSLSSPASEFFVKELSQIDQSTGLDDMGYLRPELILCALVVYLIHYLSLFRGLDSAGKVVYVTATAPYIILSVLLVRGLFLPGASMGIKYYLSPRLDKLAEPQVWIDAAVQVFYSIGVGFGVHLTYASFNSHNNDCHRDCLMTSAINALTSVYSGLVVFVYLGYMAQNLGIEIDKVASEGYSLVFEVYPEALTTLPFARFWSILFFIMLLSLGIDSAMGGLEAVITGLEDEFKFARRLSRAQLTALVVVSSFLPALISCTQGGAYTLFWLDTYSAGISLLFSALFETIGVVYCYGLKKFIPNIESMLGRKPHIFYIICWKYISPLFLGGVIIMSIVTTPGPTYRGYVFPLWSVVLGWTLAFSSVAVIPIFALWRFFTKDSKRNKTPISLDRRQRKRKSSYEKTSEKKGGPNEKKCIANRSLSVSCSDQAQGITITTSVALTDVLKDIEQDCPRISHKKAGRRGFWNPLSSINLRDGWHL